MPFIDYLLYFYIYSCMGFLMETGWAYLRTGKFLSRRTMLTLPMCPVYGIGGVIMAAFYPADGGVCVWYMLGFFAASVTEYMYSLFYERRYGIRWWNYTDYSGNVGGRICVFYSLIWGLAGIAFYGGVHGVVENAVTGAGVWGKLLLALSVSAVFIKDMTSTHNEIKNFIDNKPSKTKEIFDFIETVKKNK